MELFIYNFSTKHSLQKLNLGLACIFLKLLHLMIAVLFSRFNFHTYFDNSVSLQDQPKVLTSYKIIRLIL